MADEFEGFAPAPVKQQAPVANDDFASFKPASNPQARAVVNIGENGDAAARALKLAKQTNIPASVVETDLPGYEAHAQTQSAIKAVQNPAIAKYVVDNPMASKVSSDDYEALDEVSAYFQNLKQDKVNGKASIGVFAAVPEIAQMLGNAPGRDRLYNALTQLPGHLVSGIVDMFKVPGEVASGKVNLATPEGLDTGISFGLGVALGGSRVTAGRSAGPAGAPPTGTVSFDEFMSTLRGMETRRQMDEFLAQKAGGPPGAMLMIEKAKSASEALDATVEAAQGSKTKQRSPEMFEQALAAHGDDVVHLDAGKAMELYQKEDKVPQEGDGLLGFVPGLAEKLQTAAETGGEITIPASQYVAHIEPSVHEGLKDGVRVHDDGVTLAEAAEQQAREVQPNTVDPNATEWELYRGTPSEETSYSEHGIFFSPSKNEASAYTKYSSEDNGSLVSAKIAPGKTKVFDLRELLQTDAFHDAMIQTYMGKNKNNRFEMTEEDYRVSQDSYRQHFENDRQATLAEGQPWQVPFDQSLVDTVLKIARDEGLDTVILRGLVESGGGDQIIVLNTKQIKEKKSLVEEATSTQIKEDQASLGLDTRVFMNMILENGKAVGITEPEFAAYSKKVAAQEEAQLARATEAARKEVARPLTAEWKRNAAAIATQVRDELTSSGAFAAERYLRENKITLGGEGLGEVADGLAPLFGFETGQDMLRGLEALRTEQAASGKSPARQIDDAVKLETQARMEARYGSLQENIAKEARQIALDQHVFDVLAEEVQLLAKAAGATPALKAAELQDWIVDRFERSGIVDAANWEKHRRAAERGGRETEKALLKGDYQEAFLAKQRQMLAATLARESLKLQKLIDRTEAKIDRFTSEQVIASLDQAYLDQIRGVLESVGVPQKFEAALPLESLREFIEQSDGQLAVADWLAESPPVIKDMSVQEFREFAESLQSMEHVGRQVNKVISARGAAELQNVVFDAKRNLERFPFIDQPMNPTVFQKARSLGRRFVGAHLLVEKMFDYTDRSDPHGSLTTYIDRPLRDSHTKYLELTEKVTKMLRDLYPYTEGAGLSELIPNKLIPDALSKTGFMQMNRRNLRELMLNTGNWSNLKKASEGFGINEADLRRFIDANATAKDVAWVNGVWNIFKELKPEADAVHLRDTGVPVDTIKSVAWEIKAGKLEGGYYPITYDRMNSNIEGHIASQTSLFDKGYIQASTPKAYTKARTEFTGALDLQGLFLNSKLRGMVHDIAFREAVRSVNRVITNQEFRTAVAQYWGREAAELMPGWLKSIANSHNLDADYAPQLVRGMAMVRQNVVSTLIAFNPSTFIKHGFTAAVMSANEVGLGPLVKELMALGPKGAGQIGKDLLVRSDIVPDADYIEAFRETIMDEKRGAEIRQFVLQSSPTLRARSMKADDSIAGAIKQMDREGLTGKFGEVRDMNMLYGRFMVSFFDQMSTVPTWYAAYKNAYLKGEAHADAVFIADKAVSRAHGSSFTGDQPAVTRLPNTFLGELGRWFVPLYKFYNHFANMNFQLVWDAAAYLRGPKEGEGAAPPGATTGPDGSWHYAPEPGANAARIAKYVGLVLAIVYVESLAKPALEEEKKGFLGQMLSQAAHLFGGQFVGLREISGPAMHGFAPSTGLLGTLSKSAYDTVKDIKKAGSASATASKDWIIHTATALGFATGLGGTQIGRTGSFAKDVVTGRDRPKTFNEFRQGLRTGHSQPRKH